MQQQCHLQTLNPMKRPILLAASILLVVFNINAQFGSKPFKLTPAYSSISNKIEFGFGISHNNFVSLAPNSLRPVSADVHISYYPDRLPISLVANLNLFVAGKSNDGGNDGQHKRLEKQPGEYAAVAGLRVLLPLGTDPRKEGRIYCGIFAGLQAWFSNHNNKTVTIIPGSGLTVSCKLTDVFQVFAEGTIFLDVWNNTRTPLREISDDSVIPKKIIFPYTVESGGGTMRIGGYISLANKTIKDSFKF